MDRAAETSGAAVAEDARGGRVGRLAAAVSVLSVTALLGWAVWELPGASPGLADAVRARLTSSGVSHPVTAVLLNFRAYDTLLEIGVLLLAVVAVWAVARADVQPGTSNSPPASVPPQLTALVRLLVPWMLVTAGYLLWKGATAPGGAFPAGAVLGGAGVLLILSRPDWAARRERWWLRTGLALGLGVFLAVGVALLISRRRLLEYPPGWAGALILVIEGAATISIGLTLALLFLGGRPARSNHTEQSRATTHGHG